MRLPTSFTIRLASKADLPALEGLVSRAIGELLRPFLSPEELHASFEIMGVDTELISDRTYFVVEQSGTLAGCGGWSRRATHFGADHWHDRDSRPLDPRAEAARVRAMYTHPDFARKGIGRAILARCETEASAEDFRELELVATLAGEPLYRACGYIETERFEAQAPSGAAVPLVRMRKSM